MEWEDICHLTDGLSPEDEALMGALRNQWRPAKTAWGILGRRLTELNSIAEALILHRYWSMDPAIERLKAVRAPCQGVGFNGPLKSHFRQANSPQKPRVSVPYTRQNPPN